MAQKVKKTNDMMAQKVNKKFLEEMFSKAPQTTLGIKKILTLENFADLASDELTGGYDIVRGSKVKIDGYLEDFALSKEEADSLIMSAREIVYKD